MVNNNSVHFTSIKIEGYRGRNFELKMNPEGENTVFVMDGNTGKTTTIELLRWCFNYPESKAKGHFKHMWTKDAHVLDFEITDKEQTCTIIINFKANGNKYTFKRITTGVYVRDQSQKIEEDKIEQIYDTLEFDHGRDYLDHDDVFDYLSDHFKFNVCAEYFCFDGEKARDVMMSSSDNVKINSLLDTINKRTTNPKLEEFEEKLEKLKQKIYSQSSSKLTNVTLKTALNRLIEKEHELRLARTDQQDAKDDVQVFRKMLDKLNDDSKKLDDEIEDSKSEILLEKSRLENSIENIKEKIENNRNLIYNECLKWIEFESGNIINEIKTNVKETGKLPEPYRKDLIKECLKEPNPTCQICGRELDEDSIKRVKELEEMVATHQVHDFLSGKFYINTINFDSHGKNSNIKLLIEKYKTEFTQYDRIQLSGEDKKLIKDRDELRSRIIKIAGDKSKREQDLEDITEEIKILDGEIQDLRSKNESLTENRSVLERVDDTLNIIIESKEKTKELAINIISNVISKSVTSILGENFSAVLTEKEGLLLGENSIYGTEVGGMSGRLVLSYCFAEAMTLIDPIIVDTPSGNIGSHRDALAKHLKANHKQVILLCLPTEIENFAPHISDTDFIEIKNKVRCD